jgi:hypothetical protein
MTTETATTTGPDYTLDKATGEVTMADGFKFNPSTNENVEGLTLDQLRVYNLERPAGAPSLTEKVLALAELITESEAQAAKLKAEAAKHTSVADGFKAELRQLLDFGTHAFGNFKVTVSKPSRSFDAEAFMRSYPVEANPALYTYVINSKAVPPNLKDQFMAAGTGEPKVSIK